jgi:hypothetical protein
VIERPWWLVQVGYMVWSLLIYAPAFLLGYVAWWLGAVWLLATHAGLVVDAVWVSRWRARRLQRRAEGAR